MPTGHREGNLEGTSAYGSAQGPEVTLPDVAATAEAAPVRSCTLFTRLRDDHEEIRSLLSELRDSPAGDARDAIWKAFSFCLVCHSRAEEDALYRLMSRMPQTLDVAEISIEEHDKLQEIVARMGRMPKVDASEFGTLVPQLQASLLRHHDEEERQVLPLLADTFDDEELTRIDERYLRLKERHAHLLREGVQLPEGSYEIWPPDVLYEIAQTHRVAGRGRMGRNELIQAVRRTR